MKIAKDTIKPIGQGKKSVSQFVFFQPKLKINQPGDIYEQEADAVADKIMRMSEPGSDSVFFSPRNVPLTTIQTKCAECEQEEMLQRKEDDEEDIQLKSADNPVVHRKCAQCEEEEKIQMKKGAGAGSRMLAPSSVHDVINSGGQPLDKGTQNFMESRFGYDFGNVQVHNDTVAHQSSADINALAYTHQNHIVFAPGQYQPATHSGRQLLAHELAHVVQQGGTGNDSAGMIQREVNPGRVEDAATVLKKIKDLGNTYADLGKVLGPAVANMARLAKLGSGFNPGADTSEKNNSFVYTCRCGWIDLGHFFITAATSYAVAFLRQFESLKPGNVPFFNVPITEIPKEVLIGGQKHLRPLLTLLLSTVTTGDQAAPILKRVDELLASDDPKHIALAYGYWMEYFQQLVKLRADQLANPSEALKGSQRSAFTMEDLPSDTYGAYYGEDIWNMVSMDKDDSSPHYERMKKFFSDCGAVYSDPNSVTRCEMMAETTPGSCSVVDGKPKWTLPGEPARYTSTTPYLLKSATPLCKGKPSTPLENLTPSELKTDKDDKEKPGAVDTDRFSLFRGFRLQLGGGLKIDNFFMDPMEDMPTGSLELSWRKRQLSLTILDDIEIGGGFKTTTPIIGSVGLDGKFWGGTTVTVPGVGDVKARLGGDFDVDNLLQLQLPKIEGQFDLGPLSVDTTISIKYDRLKDLKNGPLAPEVVKLEAILKSDKVPPLVSKVLGGDIGWDEFKAEVISLIKEQYPDSLEDSLRTVIDRFVMDLISYTTVDASGTGELWGIPVFGYRAQKKHPILVRGIQAPVFQYQQWGLLFTQFLKGEALRQFPLGVGYTRNWLLGDPRPGQPALALGGTVGLGLPQSEVFVQAYGSLTTDTGLEVSAGIYYAPFRFGPRESAILEQPDLRVPPGSLQFTPERHLGPLDIYLQVKKDNLQFGLRHERSGIGPDTSLLTFGMDI